MRPTLFRDRLFMPIMVLICVIAACFLGLSAASILRNRHNHINEAVIKSRTQAQLVGENTSSMIYTVDFALLSCASMIKNQIGHDGFNPDTIAFINQEITYLPQIRDIVFMDAAGDQQWRVRKTNIPFTLTSFDRFRFAWLESAIETLFVDDKQALILLSRRVENRHNEFIGVITAIIDTAFFYERYDDSLHLDAGGVALFDSQGQVLTGWFNHPDIQAHFSSPGNSSISAFSPPIPDSGMLAGGSTTHENENTVISTYQIRDFPFHVAVMHAKKDLLEKWRQETKRDIAIIFATFITALITLVLAFRQRNLRKIAEHRLMEHQRSLEETIQRRTAQLQSANTVLQEKNDDLEAATKKIKTLSGLLPICMHCKKIRDDKGYWKQMETYIHEHSDAEFSHSICRECAEEFYPELDLYEDEDD